jgi:hypothetical protein
MANQGIKGASMRVSATACLLVVLVASASAQQRDSAPRGVGGMLESKVRQAWTDYKTKNKTDLAAMLANDFRIIEEGDTAFHDKKADIEEVDTLNLRDFKLTNFTVIPIGTHGALVTYFAEYTAIPSGQEVQGKSAFGEVWVKRGPDWVAIYAQSTPVK